MALTPHDFALIIGAPCQVISTGSFIIQTEKLIAVDILGQSVFVGGWRYLHEFEIKPILRPLSSLTEAEEQELYRLTFSVWPSYKDSRNYEAKRTRWLLAHHFCLFPEWFETGDAIDATTI